MGELKNTLEKKYIKGKSIEDLKAYAEEQGMSKEAIETTLFAIHKENWHKRKMIAYRDVLIASISIFYALHCLYMMIYNNNRAANALFVVSLFLWIPFLKSFYVVMSNKAKFEELAKK